jgi:hypothetical protein
MFESLNYKVVTDTSRNPYADLSAVGVGREARYRFIGCPQTLQTDDSRFS